MQRWETNVQVKVNKTKNNTRRERREICGSCSDVFCCVFVLTSSFRMVKRKISFPFLHKAFSLMRRLKRFQNNHKQKKGRERERVWKTGGLSRKTEISKNSLAFDSLDMAGVTPSHFEQM